MPNPSRWKVRSCIAIAFHEVCKALGPRSILLIEPFIAVMYDFIDVSQHLIKAFERTHARTRD